MSGNKMWPAAAMAAGLVALAALSGCGGEESVASKSAAAFEEAQKRGETFGGEGHGHGASPAGGENAEPAPAQPAEAGEEHSGHGAAAPAAAGEDHGGHGVAAAPSTGGMQHETAAEGMDHGAHGAAGSGAQPSTGHEAGAHAGGQGAQRSGSTRTEASGTGQEGHAGHGPATQAPAGQTGQTGHAGHSAAGGGTPARPGEDLPAQPAGILRPDSVDAPAATSVLDARRSAEMNQAMSGGHGGHGASTYRQIDAGRGPGAHEGSEPQTPGAGPQEHDHGASAATDAAVYACPMHPEVTSDRPGTCPKCGMNLVERRKE